MSAIYPSVAKIGLYFATPEATHDPITTPRAVKKSQKPLYS